MAKESELLDIKQAAALLQVSEASLRRWTNAGRLASFRVGGRRERRFRRDDLLAFLEVPPGRAGAAARAPAAHGTPGHVCGVYTSDQARTRQMARFIADGLRESSHCFLGAAPEPGRRIIAELGRIVPTLKADMTADRLVLLRYEKTVVGQLAMVTAKFETAMQRGAHSVRMAGDVSGGALARHNTVDDLLAYETELERFCKRHTNVAILCLYDARTMTGVELAQTFQAHGDTFSVSVEQLIG